MGCLSGIQEISLGSSWRKALVIAWPRENVLGLCRCWPNLKWSNSHSLEEVTLKWWQLLQVDYSDVLARILF